MRILTVFVMSFVMSIFGVLFAIFPQLWMTVEPWRSPLVWGGLVVITAWWGSIRALTTDTRTGSEGAPGSGGAGFIIMAALGTTIIMYWLI